MNSDDKRHASQKKHEELKAMAQDFLEAKRSIPTGLTAKKDIEENKERAMAHFQASEEDWNDWHWQIAHRISDAASLGKIIELSQQEIDALDSVGKKFRWGISPYYATLMDPKDSRCPIRIGMLPSMEELAMTGIADFSGEDYTNPAPKVTRWYPDRLTINVTNLCAAFCRHCLRRRHFGEVDTAAAEEDIKSALDYVRENEEIRDVLYTGGDPLTFSDEKIDWLLGELGKIDHVEIKRVGSKIPITVPQRITEKLCKILKKHHPVFMNIQVNHPRELSEEAAKACQRLADAGIPMGNQSVLLKGINDDPNVFKLLNHELLKLRVRPYYIYHCQGTLGIAHLRTPVETGMEILEKLRGWTSGFAVPDYIITPSVLGKTPLAPSYQVSEGPGYLVLRNW